MDSVVLGAAAATNTERSNGALGVIIPAYALGVPIVHALHGRWDATGASVAMRVLVPLAFVVATFNGDGSGTSDARSVLVGVGVALPVIVDAAFLAWGNPKAKRAPPAAFDVAGHVTRDAASVSVSGAF